MTFLWWLVIISAAVLVLSFFFGRSPARVHTADDIAPPEDDDLTTTVAPDDRPDSVHMKRNHGHEFAEEVSPFGADGTAKISEEPELFPDRTGTTTARALGAKDKPQDQAKDKPASGRVGGPTNAAARADGPGPEDDQAANRMAGRIDAPTAARPNGPIAGPAPAGPTDGTTIAGSTTAGTTPGINHDTPDPGTRGWDIARSDVERMREQGRLAPAHIETEPPTQGPVLEEGTGGFGAGSPKAWQP